MVDSDNRYTDYIYDGVGRLIGQWLPNDAFFGWAYNSRGLLEVKWSDVDVTSTYDWNADGSLQKLTNKTDVTTSLNGNTRSTHTYTYDAFGTQSVDDYVVASSSGNISNRSRTTRNNLGQMNAWYNQTKQPTAGTEVLVESYQYDAFGNRSRLTQAATGNYYSYSLDAAQQLNQIQQFNSSNTLIDTVNLQYDTNGSLIGKQSPQGTLTLTWDAQNRLASATSNITQTGTGSQTSTQAYTYDAFDRRISKTISAGAGASTTPVTHYLYDGDNIHAEYANWAQPINITSYTGTDNAIGRFSLPTNATAATAFSSANYLHTNAQGNTDSITQYNPTANDAITGAAVRDPFGKLSTINATVNPAINNQSPALNGRTKDETGLHNFRARYLDVDALQTISTNRFISRDPTGYAGGINPYVAFENDPLTYSDPSGTTVRLAANTVSSYYSGAVSSVSNFSSNFISASPVNSNESFASQLGSASRIGVDYGLIAFDVLNSVVSPSPDVGLIGAAGIANRAASGSSVIKNIGKIDDLKGIPRNQTLLDDLPNLGSPKANYYQNSSVLRKEIRDGSTIRDASATRLNSAPDPTLLRPDRTIGQSFLGAERNILDNKGFKLGPNNVYIPK